MCFVRGRASIRDEVSAHACARGVDGLDEVETPRSRPIGTNGASGMRGGPTEGVSGMHCVRFGLSGCYSQGDTVEEALANARERSCWPSRTWRRPFHRRSLPAAGRWRLSWGEALPAAGCSSLCFAATVNTAARARPDRLGGMGAALRVEPGPSACHDRRTPLGTSIMPDRCGQGPGLIERAAMGCRNTGESIGECHLTLISGPSRALVSTRHLGQPQIHGVGSVRERSRRTLIFTQ